MVNNYYVVAFEFTLDRSDIVIPLIARVEWHHPESYYLITEFRTPYQEEGSILPPLKIRRQNGEWVHIDSEKETSLSRRVGMAIDERERNDRNLI